MNIVNLVDEQLLIYHRDYMLECRLFDHILQKRKTRSSLGGSCVAKAKTQDQQIGQTINIFHVPIQSANNGVCDSQRYSRYPALEAKEAKQLSLKCNKPKDADQRSLALELGREQALTSAMLSA